MPQMNPMNWLIIYFLLSSAFWMNLCYTYFIKKVPNNMKTKNTYNTYNTQYMIKW